MAPKKKAQPRNSFYFFMLEFKEREEARGRFFPNGMKDVPAAADPEWKKLTSEQKKVYETMAKDWKQKQKQGADKYTTLGTRFQVIDEKARRREEEKNIMYQTIEREIESLQTKEALIDKLFYVIHVNYYCQLDNTSNEPDVYLPAEIAIIEFNLQFGILREYHTLVNVPMPQGYAYLARAHSQETHEIPVEFHKGEQSCMKILRDIKSFLMQEQKSRVLPPLYTMHNNRNLNTSYDAVKSVLEGLCDASVAEEDHGIFRVFLLGKLLFELQKKCREYDPSTASMPKPLITLAENDLEMDNYNYCSGLACDFHEEIDRTLYCSLSVVKRWAHNICENCCQFVGVDLIPGRHCPKQAGINDDVYKENSRENWRTENGRRERPEFRGGNQRSRRDGRDRAGRYDDETQNGESAASSDFANSVRSRRDGWDRAGRYDDETQNGESAASSDFVSSVRSRRDGRDRAGRYDDETQNGESAASSDFASSVRSRRDGWDRASQYDDDIQNGESAASLEYASYVRSRRDGRGDRAGRYDYETQNGESAASSDNASYVASMKSQGKPSNQRCWATVKKPSDQGQLASRFSENDFPAIGELSLSEGRNRNPVPSNPRTGGANMLSMSNFPAIGRGRSLGRGGLGRGRGMP